MKQKEKGFDYWLYHHDFSKNDFLAYINTLLNTTKKRMNVLLIVSESPLIDELRDWVPRLFDVSIEGSDKIFSLNVSKLMEKKFHKNEPARTINVRARIVKYSQLPIYMIFSDCNKSDFKNVLTKLMQKHYPKISKLFLTNKEIEKIIIALEEETNLTIDVEFIHAKRRLFGKKKKMRSDMSYTDEYHSDVFARVGSANQWIESIRFHAITSSKLASESNRKFTGVIGRASFFSGEKNFKPFLEIIIPLAIEFAYGRNKYLDIRSKILQKKKEPEAIVLKFKESPFTNIEDNKNIVETFLALEKFSVSSYHVNPYFHISLLDYLDGSSYDLWIVSDDRMIIYPQISASTASMNRVVNHIFERVEEGEMEEYGKITI